MLQETVALPFVLQVKRPVSLGGNGPLCFWACGLAETITAGSYFEFLMRRVAVAVIPRPAVAIPASAIALGAASPVFANLPAVVSACLPPLEFACLVELGGYFCRSRTSRWTVSPRPVAPSWREASSRSVALSRARWPCLPRLSPLRMPCRRRHRPFALFQIVEERISPGYELVGMGFILLCSTFTVINSSFLPFEAVAALAELRFARVFLRFCRYDFTAQLLNMLFNSYAGLLVAECFKCLI